MSWFTSQDLTSRREFDWRIIRKMSGGKYQFTAHRTPKDAVDDRSAVDQERDARHAMHYRCRFEIPTLIGPGAYSQYTLIRVDTTDPRYPFAAPTAWVIEDGISRTPYSPHFARRLPVCVGTIWSGSGRLTLGHFVVHLVRLLNWQEVLSPGYGGYNIDAIHWWRTNLNRPLTPDLAYPTLPQDELYGDESPDAGPAGGFRSLGPPPTPGAASGFSRVA